MSKKNPFEGFDDRRALTPEQMLKEIDRLEAELAETTARLAQFQWTISTPYIIRTTGTGYFTTSPNWIAYTDTDSSNNFTAISAT